MLDVGGNELSLSVASMQDVTALVDFYSAPEIDHSFVLPLSLRSEGIEEAIRRRYSLGSWLVVRSGRAIIGALAVLDDAERGIASMAFLAVHPQFRGLGIGRDLVQAGIVLARDHFHTSAIEYDTWATNTVSMQLVLGLGFVLAGEFEDPCRRPNGMKTVRFRLDL